MGEAEPGARGVGSGGELGLCAALGWAECKAYVGQQKRVSLLVTDLRDGGEEREDGVCGGHV